MKSLILKSRSIKHHRISFETHICEPGHYFDIRLQAEAKGRVTTEFGFLQVTVEDIGGVLWAFLNGNEANGLESKEE